MSSIPNYSSNPITLKPCLNINNNIMNTQIQKTLPSRHNDQNCASTLDFFSNININNNNSLKVNQIVSNTQVEITQENKLKDTHLKLLEIELIQKSYQDEILKIKFNQKDEIRRFQEKTLSLINENQRMVEYIDELKKQLKNNNMHHISSDEGREAKKIQQLYQEISNLGNQNDLLNIEIKQHKEDKQRLLQEILDEKKNVDGVKYEINAIRQESYIQIQKQLETYKQQQKEKEFHINKLERTIQNMQHDELRLQSQLDQRLIENNQLILQKDSQFLDHENLKNRVVLIQQEYDSMKNEKEFLQQYVNEYKNKYEFIENLQLEQNNTYQSQKNEADRKNQELQSEIQQYSQQIEKLQNLNHAQDSAHQQSSIVLRREHEHKMFIMQQEQNSKLQQLEQNTKILEEKAKQQQFGAESQIQDLDACWQEKYQKAIHQHNTKVKYIRDECKKFFDIMKIKYEKQIFELKDQRLQEIKNKEQASMEAYEKAKSKLTQKIENKEQQQQQFQQQNKQQASDRIEKMDNNEKHGFKNIEEDDSDNGLLPNLLAVDPNTPITQYIQFTQRYRNLGSQQQSSDNCTTQMTTQQQIILQTPENKIQKKQVLNDQCQKEGLNRNAEMKQQNNQQNVYTIKITSADQKQFNTETEDKAPVTHLRQQFSSPQTLTYQQKFQQNDDTRRQQQQKNIFLSPQQKPIFQQQFIQQHLYQSPQSFQNSGQNIVVFNHLRQNSQQINPASAQKDIQFQQNFKPGNNNNNLVNNQRKILHRKAASSINNEIKYMMSPQGQQQKQQ